MYARQDFNLLPLWWRDPESGCACGGLRSCRPAKHPIARLTPNGYKNASSDIKTVKRWWDQFPVANIGIELARSNLVAVDIDHRLGGDESEDVLIAKHGHWSDTWKHSTGDGAHVLFLKPPGIEFGSPYLADGIQLMSTGYIAAPPSVHANGLTYTWDVTGDPTDDATLAQLPDWIIKYLLDLDTHSQPTFGNMRLDCDVPRYADPSQRLLELVDSYPTVWNLWNQKNPVSTRRDKSDSAWTIGLGTSLYRRGFTDKQVCDSLVAHRMHNNAQYKPRSWFLRTCSKAKTYALDSIASQ
jgi:hypothetical protein